MSLKNYTIKTEQGSEVEISMDTHNINENSFDFVKNTFLTVKEIDKRISFELDQHPVDDKKIASLNKRKEKHQNNIETVMIKQNINALKANLRNLSLIDFDRAVKTIQNLKDQLLEKEFDIAA